MGSKIIYSAVPRKIDDNQLQVTIVADGGLMIKQFVGGEEYMKPNLSELLGSKCECVRFDILDVRVGDTRFAGKRKHVSGKSWLLGFQ
jgi:tRNA U54 and U55 pseudouridine synthase Pus10